MNKSRTGVWIRVERRFDYAVLHFVVDWNEFRGVRLPLCGISFYKQKQFNRHRAQITVIN
jgi:hypothetical protein